MDCWKIDGKYHFSDKEIAHNVSVIKMECTCQEYKKNQRGKYELPFYCKHCLYTCKYTACCSGCGLLFINEGKTKCDKCAKK
jgi:hypothetical protein